VPRVEDARLLRGRGRYVADLAPPGTLHVAFVRSPLPHARIAAVDVAAALAAPGVVACITGPDLAPSARPLRAESRMRDYYATPQPPLALDKVRFVGEAVVAVVAASRYLAEDAAELVRVDYDELAPVVEPGAAIVDGASLLHEEARTNVILRRAFTQGDVAAALAGARHVVRDRFRFRRHAGVAMEGRGCLAEHDRGSGLLTLWTATQVPGMVRDLLAGLLDHPAHLIRVVAPDVGGGFGLKSVVYPEEVALAALARRLGRPVKWVSDRREDLLTSTQAWDEQIEAELGLDGDARVVALRARVLTDVGAYSTFPWTASIEAIQVISFLPGPYRVPHYHGEALGVATSKAPMGPYRGVGRPVSAFVMEGLLDRAARRLGLDPIEIRLRNLIRPEDLPYRSASGVVWDTGSFVESLTVLAETADYAALRAEQARGDGRLLGIGVASYVELTGVGSAIPASPGADIATGTEGATVRVDASGTVTASFGIASQGQGHETALAQIVAEELGARLADVRVIQGDTAQGPVGTGTYASRTAVIAGGAATLAARALREKALAIAAHQLEASVDDIDLVDGRAWVRGAPDRAVTLRQLARAAYGGQKRLPRGMEPGLEATRFYDPFFGTAGNGSHLALVEIDRDTGVVRVLRHVVVEDCGRIINPLIVSGQSVGAVVQGIGAALLEEVVYDEGGQPITASLMDYLIPSATDVPSVTVVHLERPSPTTLGGYKGVGEGGTIGAPAAIANAVADALARAAASGGASRLDVCELPLTPERVLRLLQGR
jgi:aerobic carbon-monoxide dehydrogenase large subunit